MTRRPPGTAAAVLLFAAASLVWGMGGCSTRAVRIGGDAAAETGVPADFSIAVTVLSPGGQGRPGSARYVMEADWVLRAVLGPGVNEHVFPARTRQFTRLQVEDLWDRLAATALIDPHSPYLIGVWDPDPFDSDRRPVAEVVYLVYIAADGDRRLLAIESARAPEEDVAAARMAAETLAGLAWVR